MSSYLATETGTIRKKWKGLLPVALIYPNTYPLAVSNLGFQLVYSLLNALDFIVCERFVYPSDAGPLRSLESNRPLGDFPVVLGSVSFENDYPTLIAMLTAGLGRPPTQRSAEVAAGAPLIILGGVAIFMNPEPLAPFSDLMVIGEAEAVVPELMQKIDRLLARCEKRSALLRELASSLPGCYAPAFYSFRYGAHGVIEEISAPPGLPARIRKVVQRDRNRAAHSQLLSPAAELDMFMTELGRGCSRGCRFCAAGYIYRPPRLWSAEAILESLEQRPAAMDRIGLLGMEMAAPEVLARISDYLQHHACDLSFSSLRADRISAQLLELLAASRLKSAAIAPDGCSERLRSVINKGLARPDLLTAASGLVAAGIVNLKIYVMIGLPTETAADLGELIELIHQLKNKILPLGRKRGRVTEITLSLNSFTPKPWTPFQYTSFGGLDPEEAARQHKSEPAIASLKQKIHYLRQALAGEANLHLNVDRPELVLQQAVLARGDRRLAPVLLDMATRGLSYKQAMKKQGLSSWEYAIRPREENELFCWDIIDHQIDKSYLWREYHKGLAGKPSLPCDTTKCRRCGVCDDETAG